MTNTKSEPYSSLKYCPISASSSGSRSNGFLILRLYFCDTSSLATSKRTVLCSSLRILSELLEKHHGQKVILLIDEYDVPLAKAFELGYYNSMTLLIRNLFENALKTNDSLKFAVLTGCMRISKESIFTGLNNLKVLSVADVQFDEYFGFTDSDVKNILEYYELSEHYDEIKMWYDGYRFGNVEVYCPWDVINYCDELRINNMAQPQNYWSNTRACLKNILNCLF